MIWLLPLALPLGASLWLTLFGQHWLPLAGYALASLLTLALYAHDKRRAVAGGWRVPEATLHLLELAGGWPGALAGQRWLRHKNRKHAFQVVFWLIVLLHWGLWGAWLWWRLKQPY
ncbi:DUF1294 domain-containing protein [Neisseriaceae bacterium JH1-16]|nr:DUF1294 domain-containing protein [Neisseriaceae bacterium JH1-16]